MAVDCLIHVWYSSLLRKTDTHILRYHIKPVIQNAQDKRERHAWQWQHGHASTRVHQEIRSGPSCRGLVPSRWTSSPLRFVPWRLCTVKPVGARRFGTLSQDTDFTKSALLGEDGTWVAEGGALPTRGWCCEDVFETSAGAATSDTYDNLFYHLRDVLSRSIKNFDHTGGKITLRETDASILIGEVQGERFDHIEVGISPDMQPSTVKAGH